MDLAPWLLALIWIFIAFAVASVIALFILRSQDLKKPNNNVGPQGPKGEIGLPGLRGAQGFQGIAVAPSNFDAIRSGQIVLTPIWNFPTNPPNLANGRFVDSPAVVNVAYEILSARTSPSTVRRTVTLRASRLGVIPNTDRPSPPFVTAWGFMFDVPHSIGGSTIINPTLVPFVGHAVANGGDSTNDPAFVSPITLLSNVTGIAQGGTNGIRWLLSYFSGKFGSQALIQVNQQLLCNFQITYFYDEALPA